MPAAPSDGSSPTRSASVKTADGVTTTSRPPGRWQEGTSRCCLLRDTCDRRAGVTSTVRLARWGQGWRVVEWHRFDFLLLGADIWGTLDERPVSFLVEDHWEDDTYRPGDEVHFHHLVRLFQTLRQGAHSEIEAAKDDIISWVTDEENTVGIAMDDELLDAEEDHSMPWVVDGEDLFMQQPQ
ncbi:Hypp2470 [Branchiostoma lanceolatum]|uniref:Hypp2470 protein n=1 Tax=Branchiostoma lanceolatum TaxID=7740 RepID=A0A8J9ZTF2_BRALA|nr:Hypp2470 [Branchiostoma lanceolatum]